MNYDDNKVVASVDELVEYYRQIANPQNLYIGIEWERSGIYRDTLEPVSYEGDKGYLAVLKKLVSEVGWEITEGHRNYIFELQRGNAKVTLEADGRLELAGSAKDNLHDLAREYRLHVNEVKEMSDFLNIGWLPVGWQPFHNDDEIKFIKKKRYSIFMDFGKNEWAEPQMKRTNGLTVNFSYADEENAMKKIQTAFRITPIFGAMFASSPLSEGRVNELLDMRRNCIFSFDPERNAMPENILDKDFSFKKWIEYNINFPVFLIKRKGQSDLVPKDLTFKDWMENGYKGRYPTFYDFDQHVKTLWPDIRLRPSYIEYRVADSVPFKMAMSMPAFIKGLVFDSQNWEAVYELTKDWDYDYVLSLDRQAWKEGLKTKTQNGKDLLWYAKSLVHMSNDALHRFDRKLPSGNQEDESIYLAPLKEQIYIKEKSIAEEMIDCWESEWDKNPRRLLEWCEQET